jgi:hypothetical protein
MPGQKDRLKNKFNHFLHSLVPGRSRSPSPSVRSTRDPQASSTLVGSDLGIQPLNPPSLSSIYPSIVIDPAGNEAPGRMAELASAGFQGVKTTLQLVKRASDVFPPLKSTVAGLLGVIDIVEVCHFNQRCDGDDDLPQTTAQNQQDRQDLEQKLRAVVSIINNHANYSTTPTFTTRLEGLSA